jgi:subtilisin family serine protease
MNQFLRTTIRILLIGMFLMCLVTGWAQTKTFQNGIRKGMLKVKFTPTAVTSLNSQPVNAKSGKLTTGLQAVDLVAAQVKATGMERLFPYDARFEAKLRKHGLHLWYTVKIDDTIDPKTAVAQFKQLKEVTVAEVEREKSVAPYAIKTYTPGISTSAALPFNDPLLKDQWHYNNTGQNGYSDADINLFEAWTKTSGANNIVVAVHDEGVDVNHNDLKANIWVNTDEIPGNGVDDDANGYVDDINGYNFEKGKGAVDAQYHGSHVAGTIAAVNNNGIGVSGVAGGNGSGNGVKIMSLQIFGDAAVEKSYVYAANNGAVISQNSWGYTATGSYEQVVLDAIDYFVAEAGDYEGSPMKGGIVIFAAGNMNSDANWYPQYHANTFAVASIGPEWQKASYSNYGAWVEVSAPGGDSGGYGSKAGVLSTIPNNQYAYLNGTSMACPHVSGIAALALANRTRQLTNTELWNKLKTAVVGIDQKNPNHVGKLGTGAIDASLAIQNDLGLAPAAVSTLAVTGIAQEFATLKWTVPTDADDVKPTSFNLYYHTEPITSGTLGAAGKVTINNTLAPGMQFSYELTNLLGVTTYHFAVTSTDRWGNISLISNIVSAKTNQGPSIAVDENSEEIELMIDATASKSATHDIIIRNDTSGILRWNHFMRHTNTSLAFNVAALSYPVVTKTTSTHANVSMRNSAVTADYTKLRSNEPEVSSFTQIEKTYAWAEFIIGEEDLALTNSATARFYVNEAEGFNLTNVQMYLNHDPELGPVIMEVYKGSAPTKNNLVYAQEYQHYTAGEFSAYINLDEQLYFESGSTFWIAFHVPAGNLYPLGIGPEADPSYSANCFMSFNLGNTWTPLEDIARSTLAWAISANSYNPHLGTYLTLSPGSGDVNGEQEISTTLTADASTLINGDYTANLVIASNDAKNQELRIPVSLTVTGHKPNIKHTDIADYGSVFVGTGKILELVLENKGYGNFNDPVFTIDNPQFEIVDYAPWQIAAREEVVVKIKFTPTAPGNTNGVLDFTDGNQSYQIPLFGVGAETTKISVTPQSQTINNITIGDVVHAQITVQNTGAYPLKYFIPGHDSKGISDNWPSEYHSYGYKVRTNNASEADPIAYEFQNIATTGVDITSQVISDRTYAAVDMGFAFPYYGQSMDSIYIAQKGFTTFDKSVRPLNTPDLSGSRPAGYISPLGTFFTLISQGKIFYQVEPDRLIIQYDNVTDGYGATTTTQMVLYANGNIRFFYDEISFSNTSLNILIEDVAKQDGIMLNNWKNPIDLYNGLAIGFDYPGPNIITHIENGSGVLAVGASAVVDLELSTSSLVEGTVNRSINFISNDPAHAETNALVQLEITDGGIPQPEVSTNNIAFGDVFQGAVKSTKFVIKNTGSANIDITSMTLTDDEFMVSGDIPTIIKPGLYKIYEVQIPTSVLATLDDQLSINYADGSSTVIHVTGNVIDAPGITVDLSPLQQTLAYGETSSHPFTIKNTGLAPLEVVSTGKQWLSFETTAVPASHNYTFEKYNTGENYQWIDIRESGTQMPFTDANYSKESFWRELTLPFPFEFYGQSYTEIKIGDNGLVSFEDDPEIMLGSDHIPSTAYEGKYIMPYWTWGGFNTIFYPKEDVGIFYQFFDDKAIITWSYLRNNFGGMGDPISAQMFLYKNGTMKFQYRVEDEGSDQTSHLTLIGLQESSANGISISNKLSLDHGNGIAIMVLPAKKYIIASGATLSGEIKLDAGNIYGGQYNASLIIRNNAPNTELLEKPIELTVTGDAEISIANEVDFGSKMAVVDDWGTANAYYIDLKIGNVGAGPFDLTWAQMADGSQGLSVQVWAYVQDFMGNLSWRWADIGELYSPWSLPPVMTVNPYDIVKARAVFAPTSAGDFTDELVLTTTLGETRVILKGKCFEPPILHVTTTSINEVMNTLNEKVNRSIAFENEGLSDLNYEVSIDFGRATSARATSEAINLAGIGSEMLRLTNASGSNAVAQTQATYNRTITHTSTVSPNTFVGVGTAGTFRVATKYNSGAQGFNLSHVETWFRREILTSGTILVEIRAGGTSVADATKVGEGELQFSGTGTDNSGNWYTIKLNQPAGLYPNEDFYVVVTYPLGVALPQGSITNEPTTPGRYFYFNFEKAEWADVQKIATFETMGWLMFAAEETAGNSSWLAIKTPLAGTVTAGNQSSIDLLIEGAYSQRGDQIADVVLVSNDPKKDTVRIPVKLHMNEAPHFNSVPEGIFVEEGKTINLNLTVKDEENHPFTLAIKDVQPWLTYDFTNGTLVLTLKPDYGHAGNYNVVFVATDHYNAVRELSIPVEIAHTNRAPKFIGENGSMNFNATGVLNTFEIEDFFSDPDGDDFTFTLANNNSAAVVVFSSESEFLIRPIAVGEAKLAFTVTDSYGAITRDTITAKVDIVLGAEEEWVNNGLGVYPNPAVDHATITVTNDWTGDVAISVVDVNGKQHVTRQLDTANAREAKVDVSKLTKGIYILRANSSNKQATIKLIKK